MVTLEKLVKALDALNVLNDTSSELTDESIARKKEKMGLCTTIADSMCSPLIKSAPNFPSLLSFSMATLLKMCDDHDSNIRMIADEGLNRIIRSMMDNNIVKVQVELHKEIKKNGSVRSLRAALWRFAQLAGMIRPQKGKPYVQNLVPCLVEISKRREEPVLETLSTAIPKIMMALGNFTTDSDIKKLLKSFLVNLSSDVPVVRRTAATSILSICLHCRKPIVFITYALNTIIESIVPVNEDQNRALILGALNCVRLLLPHLPLFNEDSDPGLRGSFGIRSSAQDTPLGVDRLIQVYELCLHFTHDPDHNMVTSALETLNQLLTSAPPSLIDVLMCDEGLTRSHILPSDSELLSHRSVSEMSLSMPLVPPDESALFDVPEETVKTTRLMQWIHDIPPSSLEMTPFSQKSYLDSEADAEYTPLFDDVTQFVITSKPIHRAPSLESDILIGRINETPSPESSRPHVPQSWNIGSAMSSGEKPLIYCCRRLVTGFLLPETSSSIRVRISVRTLALQCVSQVFRIFPDLFVYPIENNQNLTLDGFTHISDILCFSFHSDQQLRGINRLLIGQLIHSALVQSDGSFCDWYEKIKAQIKPVPLTKLVSLLVSGLQDETSVCIRHTLGSLSICAQTLLKSKDSHVALPILYELTEVARNSYWLVKVKLLELMAELPYIDLHYITGSGEYQTQILYSVISTLLGDDDNRVRKSASECILKMVPHLYFPIDERKEDVVITSAARSSRSILSGLFSNTIGPSGNCSVEKTLSRIIHFLTKMLLQTSSKSIVAGCCEALHLLSQNYTTTDYPRAWQCTLDKVKSGYSASSGLLSSTMALLMAAPIALDLDIQNWLFTLVGNLFYGLGVCSLENAHSNCSLDSRQFWANFHDKKLASVNKLLLNHILQVLCLFVRVLDETPISSSTTSPIKHLGRHSAPARAHAEAVLEEDDIHEEESARVSGQFIHFPHYFKLYESLRSAYANYKTVLESSDKLSSLLRAVLGTLSQLLEFSTLVETGDIAEEILNYLHTTISLEPTASVNAVQQLLKSLFGANLIAQWEDDKGIPSQMKSKISSSDHKQYYGYYENVLQHSYDQLTEYIEENNKQLKDHSKGLNTPVRERKASSILKGLGRNTDRNALASFIRLFEPMVIQALKQYTVTSDVSLQAAVLSLLTQLVQLRVNYCLLDSDQIFIKFVLRQFEFLELGQIDNVEMLVAKIFRFLVHLSYEKNHSKPVISVAKVIQLCDGLMASGQNPLTHCVPALLPIVEHVFLATIYIDGKQVEAQREVVISMLLRIAEHHQVLQLLSLILHEGWRWEDKWRRWSRQTADTILPLLAEGKIRLDSSSALFTFLQLLNNLAPGTLRPIDPVLKVFFAVQQSEVEGANIIHSFGAMLVMLAYIICYGKEEGVLSRLEDLNLCVGEEGSDPLNVTASNQADLPQTVMARLLLRVLMNLTMQFHTVVFNCSNDSQYTEYLEYLLAHFLLCYIYLIKSGNYTLISAQFITLIHDNDKESFLQLNKLFYSFSTKSPILTLQWCYFVMLLSYKDVEFWNSVMLSIDNSVFNKPNTNANVKNNFLSLNTDIVRQGSTILFCEFFKENVTDMEQLSSFLFDHIQEIILLSREPHVLNWLATLNRNPISSGLMMEAITQRCTFIEQPGFVSQLLNCLNLVHLCNSGVTLKLIALSLLEHQHLAPARIASSLACRCAEYLLTLKKEDAIKQFGKEDLLHIIQILTRSNQIARKHSGLVSLLHKLASQNFDLPPIAVEQGRSVNTASISSIILDRTWFLTQVKLRSCQSESSTRQCAYLLSELDHDDILSVLRCQQFNNGILQYCFLLGTQLSLQASKKENDCNGKGILSPLYTAAKQSLFQHIHHLRSLLPKTHQVYCPVGRMPTCKETIYQERVNQLFADVEFSNAVFRLVPATISYFSSLSDLSDEINRTELMVPEESWKDLTRFAVLCMEAVHWLFDLPSKPSNWPSLVYSALKCADSMMKQDQICVSLSNCDLGSIIATLVGIIQSCSTNGLPSVFSINKTDSNDVREGEHLLNSYLCHQIAALVTWLENHDSRPFIIPGFLVYNIKCIVMGIGRSPLVNWHCRTPTDAWTHVIFEESKPSPPLPTHLLQDIDLLHQIIFRISVFGWTSRQQFEETWVSLLSIINSNPHSDVEVDEINAVMQANSIAVQAITNLLIQTMLLPKPGNPNIGHLLHITRDKKIDLSSISWGKKLDKISRTICLKLSDCCRNIKTNILINGINTHCNLEKLHCSHRYGYGQVSIQFLKTAIMTSEEKSTSSETCLEFLKQQERLTKCGLDLHSCIQFLLDLYSQWTEIEGGISLNLLLEIVRSMVMLSDLFTERSHFSWMLKTCLDLSKIHSQEDEVLQQYLVVAVCKATAVLTVMESDVMDRVIKLLEHSLRSTFLTTRVGALHGLMYLFESLSHGNKNLTLIWDSTAVKSTLPDPRIRIYQLGTDYIIKNFDADSIALSNEDQLITSIMIFNLLEHSPQDLPQDVKTILMKFIKAASNTQHISVYQMFVQGLNRLVLINKKAIFRESIIWFALEQLSQADPAVSLPALQLLISCIYSAEFGRSEEGMDELDPEQLVVTMEKTSALFDRIKKGCPLEVECVCAALPCLLADFFPASEVLTKVIGEFLSPQQPHPQLLSAVVFQVLSQACREYQLPLLQAWLVMSLNNFTQALPVAISMWCLTCFFISASTNPWMRAIFPYIQSRIGRCTNEDRKLLCIAASDFYKQLTDESQKQTFLKTFRAAATSPRSPFADVIASL